MRVKIALVLVVTAVFLVAVLWGLDLDVALSALAATKWSFLLPMWGLYLCAHSVRSVRLGMLVGEKIPFRRLFTINSIGFLAINVIPLRLGELVRPYLLSERQGVPFGRAMAAIVVERLLDMGMLLCMLLGLTLVVDLPDGGVVVQGVDVVQAGQRAAGLLVALGTTVGLLLVTVGEPAIRLVERFPALGPKLGVFARRFREGFLILVERPLRGLLLVAMSATVWLLTICAVWTVMAAFPGIPAGFGQAWSTWTITLSGMTALPTPGFFGGYEAFCSAALWLWGVDPDRGRTFALVLHLGQFSFTVGIGLAFVLAEGLSLRQLVQPAPPAADGERA